jgi:arsenate reductase
VKFHENFPDPAKATGTEEEVKAQFKNARNLIKAYCQQWVKENLA